MRTSIQLPIIALPGCGEKIATRIAKLPVEQRVQATLNLVYADPTCVPPQRVAEAQEDAGRWRRSPGSGRRSNRRCGHPRDVFRPWSGGALASRRAHQGPGPTHLRPAGQVGQPARGQTRIAAFPALPGDGPAPFRARVADGTPGDGGAGVAAPHRAVRLIRAVCRPPRARSLPVGPPGKEMDIREGKYHVHFPDVHFLPTWSDGVTPDPQPRNWVTGGQHPEVHERDGDDPAHRGRQRPATGTSHQFVGGQAQAELGSST